MYPAPLLKSKQKDLIPSTASDSETENEHDVPSSYQLKTGDDSDIEDTPPISEQNNGITVNDGKEMQTFGKDQMQGGEAQIPSIMDVDKGKENPMPDEELLPDVDSGRNIVCGDQEDVYLSVVQ